MKEIILWVPKAVRGCLKENPCKNYPPFTLAWVAVIPAKASVRWSGSSCKASESAGKRVRVWATILNNCCSSNYKANIVQSSGLKILGVIKWHQLSLCTPKWFSTCTWSLSCIARPSHHALQSWRKFRKCRPAMSMITGSPIMMNCRLPSTSSFAAQCLYIVSAMPSPVFRMLSRGPAHRVRPDM